MVEDAPQRLRQQLGEARRMIDAVEANADRANPAACLAAMVALEAAVPALKAAEKTVAFSAWYSGLTDDDE
jgi:hypothetical protein